MKKITTIFALVAACNAFAQDYTVRTLTFEDSDSKGVVNYNANDNAWSSLIDDTQYGGSLLYPSSTDVVYGWYDENNTEIMSELTNNYYDACYWGGGIAISNYVDSDLADGTYEYQLSVPSSNGSSNFAVVYCNANPTISEYNPQTSFSFADEAHVIESALVGPTTYQLNVAENGNDFAKALTDEGDYMTVNFVGYNDADTTATVSVDLARDGKFLEDWTEIDLTALGKVTKVLLTITSSDAGTWGVNQASYFAIDDIKVRFDNDGTSTAVESLASDVVNVEYYDILGRKSSSAHKGVNIVRTTKADGTVKVVKTIVK